MPSVLVRKAATPAGLEHRARMTVPDSVRRSRPARVFARITIGLDEDLYRQIETEAEKAERSLTAQVVYWLKQGRDAEMRQREGTHP